MRGWFRVLTCVAVLSIASVACTSTTETANNTPASSPSASPSPSPSASPSASPSSEPTPSSTPSSSGGSLAITSLPFHNGEVGIGYLAVTLGASGGTAPYTWALAGGAFPPGLTLSSDGVVTGTNTQAGQFSFTVKVTDSTNASATSPGGFGVFSALSVTQPCAQQCTVGAGCSVCGNFGKVSGGAGPYTFKLVGGYVPSGMALNGLTLSGAFPQSPLGAYNVSVQVTDGFNATQVVNGSWFVYNPADLSAGGDCRDANFTGTCTASGWSYTGGGPNDPKVIVVGISCPVNAYCTPDTPVDFSATAKGGNISITASVPANATCGGPNGYPYEYFAIFTLALVDKSKCATTLQSNTGNVIVQVFDRNCG